MSVTTEASSLFELPGVNTAVERLQELGSRMRSAEFGFQGDDVKNVDAVIEAIRELENEVRQEHEKLETETIKASVLRHRLHYLPGKIKRQIQEAVAAARQSNAEELQSLQNKLKEIAESIEYFEKKHKDFEQDNSVLHPERDRVRQEHEDIIAQLNQRMAEKASNQIFLNETRDRVRETNQKIVDLEEGIIQLKEDLIQERADARMEKKRLKKAVYDTTVKTREQKELNIEKRREVDELHERVLDLEGQLAELRKSIRQFETSKSKLEGQERALTAQLQRQLKLNEDLGQKGLEITNEIAKQDADFQEAKDGLENQIKELEEDMVYESQREEENSVKRLKLQAVVKDKVKVRKLDEKRVNEQNAVLQKAKGELAVKAEETARLRQENMDMETRIIELNETHEAIMATLHKQIDECREQLSKERTERMALQETRDTGQKGLDHMKVEVTKSINDMNRRINEGKQHHDSLTKEGTSLQKAIRDDDDRIKQLESAVTNAKQMFAEQKDTRERQIQQIEEDIVTLTEAEVEKVEEIEERMPSFVELERSFALVEEVYEKTKKEVISLKNKKTGLDDHVKRARKELEKMINPRDQVKKEIDKKRKDSIEHMKKRNHEVKVIEGQIFEVGKKLRTAVEENDRFVQANTRLEQEIVDLNKEVQNNSTKRVQLGELFTNLRGELSDGWEGDKKLEAQFCDRDEEVVKELDQLLDKAAKREHIISDVTFKLQDELAVLADFLDNVAKRRPPELVPRPPSSAKSLSRSRLTTPAHSRMGSEGQKSERSVTIATTPASRSHTPKPAAQ